MLLCVILVWPTKFENSLSFMQNMFAIWEFKDKWLKTLFLRNLGSKQVFWKAFHLILMHFIHKILCFEEFLHKIALFFKKKKLCFPDFRSIETVSRLIKNVIKILVWIWPFQSLLDFFWINRRHFQSIESNFWSIENCIESFIKTLFLTCSNTISKLSKDFLSLFDWSKIPSKIFVIFPQFSSRVFVI